MHKLVYVNRLTVPQHKDNLGVLRMLPALYCVLHVYRIRTIKKTSVFSDRFVPAFSGISIMVISPLL